MRAPLLLAETLLGALLGLLGDVGVLQRAAETIISQTPQVDLQGYAGVGATYAFKPPATLFGFFSPLSLALGTVVLTC